MLPNIVRILSIILTTSATSASVERANLALLYKNWFLEHNVNALLLRYVHRDIKLDYQKIYRHVCYVLSNNGSKNPINWTVTDEKFNFVLRDFEVF